MRLYVVAVKDRALDAYMRPFFVPALNAAVRSFQDEINRPESEMFKHPDDYDLYHLSIFDDVTGAFELFDTPQQLALGKHFHKGEK